VSESGTGRRLAWLTLQVLGSVAAFAYLFSLVDLDEVLAAARDIPATSMGVAVGLMGGAMVLGALRWRALLLAYGAARVPRLAPLVHLYFVGLFYNTYLPGGVGGDVVRGVITRRAFDGTGATAAVTVVLVERVLGLAALLAMVASVVAFAPPPGLASLLGWALAGIGAAVAAVASIPAARRLAGFVPFARLRRMLEALPALRSRRHFLLALAYSFGTQSTMALIGYTLLTALAPDFRLADAFAIVPLASATAFLPITVGGAGAREAAFVALCTAATDMDETRAATAGLAMWTATLVVAGVGGLLQLLRPRLASSEAEAPPSAQGESADPGSLPRSTAAEPPMERLGDKS